MKIKDQYNNCLHVYQSKSGAIQMTIGEHGHAELSFEQIKSLRIENSLTGIEDFSKKDYTNYYKNKKINSNNFIEEFNGVKCDIEQLVEYDYEDESEHYDESDEKENHIFKSKLAVEKFLQKLFK